MAAALGDNVARARGGGGDGGGDGGGAGARGAVWRRAHARTRARVCASPGGARCPRPRCDRCSPLRAVHVAARWRPTSLAPSPLSPPLRPPRCRARIPSPPPPSPPMASSLSRSRAALLLVLPAAALLALVSHRAFPRPHSFSPLPRAAAPPPPRCFIYDRPPRTASTTISFALHACLRAHSFRQPPRETRRSLIPSTLFHNLTSSRRALVSRHFYLNPRSISLLHSRCSALFYVTSCAPMRQRLLSASKYTLSGGHGNSTLDRRQALAAVHKANSSVRQKRFLTHYPYVDDDKQPINVSAPLLPDYVIRKSHLRHDLSQLLGALHCDTHFVSGNVHRAPPNQTDLSRHVVVHDDALYQSLSRRALSHNALALERLARFMSA